MFNNPYYQLIKKLEKNLNKNVNDYLFRISMQSDLERVKTFGSSRIGISNNLWNKLNEYPKEILPKYPLRHDEVVIASYWQDLEKDVKLEDGTLKHKLKIYKEPFFTIYYKKDLLKLGEEKSLGSNNQGTHFYFLKNPKECLDSLWQIIEIENEYDVKEIQWK